MALLPKKWSAKRRAGVIVIGVVLAIVVLIFFDILPIGYKHVTIPQDTAFSGTMEARALPILTCPEVSHSIIKLHYHVPGEKQLYNTPIFSSLCPTYTRTELLYW
jgi:hypothetical protein